MDYIKEVEISNRRKIMDILCKCPHGLRKREISSFTGIWVGDLVKPIADMEAEGIITHYTVRDMANMEWYDVYYIRG